MEMFPSFSTRIPGRVATHLPFLSKIPSPAEDLGGMVTVEPGVTWSPTTADIDRATGHSPINGTEELGGTSLQNPALVVPLDILW